MPRRRRNIVVGELYHIVNRGNERRVLFAQDDDFEHFIDLLTRGRERAEVTVHGFCLMSTHFHLLLRPQSEHALSEYMHWVTGRYAYDLREKTATLGHGHVFQRRYFSKHVEDELGWLTVLGYIEGNPKVAGAVARAQDWPWCSLADRERPRRGLATYDHIHLPHRWAEMVNLPWREFLAALVEHELEKLQRRRTGLY